MRAGITNPIPITEPEAAACYTLSSEEGQFVRAGTHIVVCDAGGGTVDLISYKVTSTKPLRLEESTVGTAGLCGSTYLNEDFRCLVKSLMGSDAYAELLRTKPKAMLSAVENFDAEVKRKFTLTDTDDYTVPINGAPNNPRIGIMDSFMTFTSDQVESVMAPTVNKVLKLIDVQVSQILKRGDHVAKVLLVGGFGQCRYLLERAQARYQGQMLDSLIFPQKRNKRDVSEPIQDRIEILQPNHAWTAVVRGAVLRGLEGDIIRGRKSRYNYGTVANVVFDRHTHGGRPFKDRHERVYYKRNVMQWFLKRGDVVRPNSTYRMNFSETWGGQRFPYARDLNVVNKVYANADDLAPTYWKETSMRLVCVLNVDLEQVPCDYFDNKQTDEGTFYWDLQYQLEMRFGDRELEFELKIGDESFGTVKAEFEAEQD